MKQYKQILRNYVWTLLLVLPLLFSTNACSDDDNDPITPSINEAELLVQQLEGPNGDYMNTVCPAIVTAQNVYEDVNGQKKMYLIDIRQPADYASGHIDGAVNVPVGDILTHVNSINVADYSHLVVICYSGQTAGWGTALLRMSGYNTAFSMKYGMSSWHSDFDRITSKCGSSYLNQFVTTDALSKPAAGDLPTLNTGKQDGAGILGDRISAVLAEGFGSATVDAASIFASPDQYFIVNYWSETDYTNIGHIDGAYQYTPKSDLKFATFLKTLPTDKQVVIYCYTGQTSANVAAILRAMGYDAKSLVYGTQGMIWQRMRDNGKTAFNAADDCMEFPYEQ